MTFGETRVVQWWVRLVGAILLLLLILLANTCVGEENQEQEQNRTNQTHPPLDNTRFTEGHHLTDGVSVAVLSTPSSVSRVDEKIQANAAENIILANVSLGAMGFSLLSINWQVIRSPKATG